MKLNWFSPVPPTPSPAALQTAAVLPALAKHATVTLWVHEASSSPDLDQHARVCRYDPDGMPWDEINAADATVYHLGNEAQIYGPIREVKRQHPGIVILHDLGPLQDSASIGAALENAIAVVVDTPAAYSLVSEFATFPVSLLPFSSLSETPDSETVEDHVNGLLDLVKTTLESPGHEVVRWMASRTGRTLRPWFFEAAAGVLVTGVAQTIKDLFDDRPN
ncbi:MAG TPA: hypothetical protein VGM62_19655 [Chthoniobacterales bacterium]|jgi:hypothetical protein